MKNKREHILGLINGLVQDFGFYNQHYHQHFLLGDLLLAIKDGDISVDEIAEHFKTQLQSHLDSVENDSSAQKSATNP